MGRLRRRRRASETSPFLVALRTAAASGSLFRVNRSGLDTWMLARQELCSEQGADEAALVRDEVLRSEVYAELLLLAPAIFRTYGELVAARAVCASWGWEPYLRPDGRVEAFRAKPLNREARRRAEKEARRAGA